MSEIQHPTAMFRQPGLDLICPASAALMGIDAARVLLCADEDSVMAMIDHGHLRWAWDISVSGGPLREVRIWIQCVVARQRGLPQPGRALGDVIPEVIGVTTRTRLQASKVRDLLNCSQQHIQRLVEAGALQGDVEQRTRWVTRESLERFLTVRRIA